MAIPETYSPSVGMRNVTHANENILVNLVATVSGADVEFVSFEPAIPLRVTLKRGDAILFDDAVTSDPKNGSRISTSMPVGGSGEPIRLTIGTAQGNTLISAETNINSLLPPRGRRSQ